MVILKKQQILGSNKLKKATVIFNKPHSKMIESTFSFLELIA